ncbi:YggT family protein [Canibacter zhoujuaniae]|uniref:YggT family protein n=1 Tax=Canibacter zhoujuaniae TaxID=2708343 RepID=UPI001FBA7793|nr:YggT family protein [Canibacter zhoujuaniae]
MGILAVVISIAFLALRIYLYVLWARLIIDWVLVLNRRFRPRGIVLVLFEIIFTVTDPPLKLIRRWVKPVRVGEVMLDLSLMILMFAIIVLMNVLTFVVLR